MVHQVTIEKIPVLLGLIVLILLGGWVTPLDPLVGKYISQLPKDPINNLTQKYCYTYYNEPNIYLAQNGNPYQNCINTVTNEIATSSMYAYILYVELEKPPSNRFRPRFSSATQPIATNPPANTCIFGPRLK